MTTTTELLAMPEQAPIKARSSDVTADTSHTTGDEDTCSESGEFTTPNTSAPEEAPVGTEVNQVSKPQRPRVIFHTIEVREYPRCLGDNPSVTAGPPLSLGWNFSQRYLLDFEEYEQLKYSTADTSEETEECEEKMDAQPRRARLPAEFQLPSYMRHQILRDECAHDDVEAKKSDTSCTDQEIDACIKEVLRTKMRRNHSFASQEFEHVEIVVESAVRKIRRLVRHCSKKQSQKDALLEEQWMAATEKTTTTIHNSTKSILKDNGRPEQQSGKSVSTESNSDCGSSDG